MSDASFVLVDMSYIQPVQLDLAEICLVIPASSAAGPHHLILQGALAVLHCCLLL